MTFTTHRALPITGALLLASTFLAACEVNLNTEGLSARETKTFKVAGLPEIDLDTFDGAIEIHSWDKAEVEVEIEKRAMEQSLIDQIKVEATQQGDKIVLKVTGPSRTEYGGLTIGVHIAPTARLRVAVPRASNIVARSGDGSIRAEALDGKIALTTVDGSVTATRLAGDINIRSGDGSIRLDKITGKIDVDTVMTDNWDLTTGDGSITLTLPSVFNAELDAETSDGTVRSSHPLLEDQAGERKPGEDSDERRERRRTMRSKMGEGGKALKVRTGDGTIRIER